MMVSSLYSMLELSIATHKIFSLGLNQKLNKNEGCYLPLFTIHWGGDWTERLEAQSTHHDTDPAEERHESSVGVEAADLRPRILGNSQNLVHGRNAEPLRGARRALTDPDHGVFRDRPAGQGV
jgi:hypothetical protein